MFRTCSLAFFTALLLAVSVPDGLAQRLNLGGRTIELIDGKVSDSTAKEVIDYSRNLYERGAYDQSVKNLTTIIPRYEGSELGIAYFLRGKASFMLGYSNSSVRILEQSYQDFLLAFDRFRSAPFVRGGELEKTISTAVEHSVELVASPESECCDNVDVRKLDIAVKFYGSSGF